METKFTTEEKDRIYRNIGVQNCYNTFISLGVISGICAICSMIFEIYIDAVRYKGITNGNYSFYYDDSIKTMKIEDHTILIPKDVIFGMLNTVGIGNLSIGSSICYNMGEGVGIRNLFYSTDWPNSYGFFVIDRKILDKMFDDIKTI